MLSKVQKERFLGTRAVVLPHFFFVDGDAQELNFFQVQVQSGGGHQTLSCLVSNDGSKCVFFCINKNQVQKGRED